MPDTNTGGPSEAGAIDWPGVGRRLKAARQRAGLTQKAAAARAGVHYVSISRWENGEPLRTGDLRQLAATYDADPERLLHGEAPAAAPPVHPAEHRPGYWEGRVAEIADQLEAATARLRAFQSAAPRWEAPTVLARLGIDPAEALGVEGGSVPRPSDEEMAALQAVRRRRIAQKMRELEEHGPPKEPPNAPPAPRGRAGGE